jgi:hypothetical protein
VAASDVSEPYKQAAAQFAEQSCAAAEASEQQDAPQSEQTALAHSPRLPAQLSPLESAQKAEQPGEPAAHSQATMQPEA